MSTNTNNNGIAIPTAGSGYLGVTGDGVKIEQLAMRSMEETGAASVTVGLYFQGPGLDHPTQVTAVIDREGNLRVIDRTSDTAPANNSNN
ncbi:hypothetical protein NOF04DRAFT_18510 [Fusarium oxysporum II5]|uniref:Uncharacterized protein n=3 Tax=Fusarium oxysporum species complex TaxID=171631 RepID=N1S006_FUSC4|nr:uncharacterized protein FOIG_04763 [Fusarium odoratissimum NRRL 54006]EMT69822.1 hypothetical protein FOC4_g10008257 [Fusarium odoratissimum]EXM04551.1 hypothetical protein FOIG_04763 [Fusarium odoratissimum NRRL 54006]KAK2126642.1 hypothetical protein NOF04DRAFT_18510 [Fusarium oxysporum II5]TXB98872.1 hypothetical protein FocTR4_00012485 [Fusarium oxysporum f. sp. cubense]